MPERNRSATQRRSRRKHAIKPVSIEELRAAAGMTGYLSILDPPAAAPHLEQLARTPAVVPAAAPADQASFSKEVRRQLERRRRGLGDILDLAVRRNVLLSLAARQAEAWQSRWIRRMRADRRNSDKQSQEDEQ